jgi:hypothetical protein
VTGVRPKVLVRSVVVLVVLGAAVGLGTAAAHSQKPVSRALPAPVPAISDYQLASTAPPVFGPIWDA